MSLTGFLAQNSLMQYDSEERMQTDSAGEEADSSLPKQNENLCLKKSRLIPPRKKVLYLSADCH